MHAMTISRKVLALTAVLGVLLGMWLSPGRAYAADPLGVAECWVKSDMGCVWDAQHRAGVKRSHIVVGMYDNRRTIRIGHKFAHRIASGNGAARSEDAPGVWDAKHRGNGVGRSFIATPDGRVFYIRHPYAHRLSGYTH